MADYIYGKVSDYTKTNGWITGSFFPTKELNHDNKVEIRVDYFDEDKSFSSHYHSKRKSWTIVLKGCMKLIINGNEINLREGEFIIYEPGVTEELVSVDKGTIAVSIHSPSFKTPDKINI